MQSYRRYQERGATFVEAAIALPIFFTLIFASVNGLLLSYQSIALQRGVIAATRWGIIRERFKGSTETPEELIVRQLLFECERLSLVLNDSNSTINICTLANLQATGECLGRNAGAPEEEIMIAVEYTSSLAGVPLTIRKTALGRNEPGGG